MTINFGPVDATSGSPTYSGKSERQMRAPLLGNPTGRVLGGRSGWRAGTPSSVVTVTSTTWTLNPCAAMIEPAAMLYQGAYPWTTDQAVTGAVTAADATNPRIDILYIQVNDSSSGDASGALSAPVMYKAGTAASTPIAPSPDPRSFLVATINVPKSGAGAPTVTFNAQYFVASGGILPVMSQTERDGLTPYAGFAVSRLDLPGNPIQTYDGAAWWPQQLAPLQTTGWALSGDIDVTAVGTHKRVTGTLHINRTGGTFTPQAGTYTAIGGSGTQLLPNAAVSSAGAPYYSVGIVTGAAITPVKGIVFVSGSNGAVSFMPDTTFNWPTNAFLDVNINHTV